MSFTFIANNKLKTEECLW